MGFNLGAIIDDSIQKNKDRGKEINTFYFIEYMDKVEVYRAFFIFVVAYSTFTVVYTTYNFIMVNTFDTLTLVIRAFALCLIFIMFFMFWDITRTKFSNNV